MDTGLLSYTGLDAAFDSSDIVLLAIDSETNEDATTAARSKARPSSRGGAMAIGRQRVTTCAT